MSQIKWVQNISILILISALLGLSPLIANASTLQATNITADSLDLSWSQSTSSHFSRYEIYQALEPINNVDPPGAPALSEWSVLTLFLLLLLTGILFHKRFHKVVGIGLILLSVSIIVYGVINVLPIATITTIGQTSYHASGLSAIPAPLEILPKSVYYR